MTDQATTVTGRRGSGRGYGSRIGTSAGPTPFGSAGRSTHGVRPGPDLRAWRVAALDRLLNRAASPVEGLTERVEALARSCLGLDELFQFEMGVSEDGAGAVGAMLRLDPPASREPPGPLAAPVAALVARQCAVVADGLLPALAARGIVVVDHDDLDGADRSLLRAEFERWIFPTLTPMAVDHGHPFPAISNLSLNLVARVRRPSTGDTRLARVKVPPLLPRFVPLGDGVRVVPVEAVIAAHLGSLFSGMTIVDHHAFRVTRTAADASPTSVLPGWPAVPERRRRGRFGPAVRLEVAAGIPAELLEAVSEGTGVPPSGVFHLEGLLQPADLQALLALRTGGRIHSDSPLPSDSPLQPAALSAGSSGPTTGRSSVSPSPIAAPRAVVPPLRSSPPSDPSPTGRTRWWRRRPWSRGR